VNTGLAIDVPGLPRDDHGPVFAEPWEAHAFAMAVALHEQGAFTWKEWAATLAEVIAEDAERPYYRQWLVALERIVERKRLLSHESLEVRKREWDEAARRTPHGQPIELHPATEQSSSR
jgi:nitrile hydratase accessory protein